MSELTLSYSKKDMFDACRYRYYLYYIRKAEPTDMVISLLSGSLVHGAIAEAEQNGKDPLKTYIKLAEAEKGFTDLPEYSLGLDLMNNWQEWKSNRPEDEIIKGIELPLKIITPSGIPFVAKMDRLSYIPSKDLWMIIDYKTSRNKVARNKVKNHWQLNSYILGLLTQNNVPREKLRAELLYLRDLDTRVIMGEEAEVFAVEKDIKRTYHEILKEKIFPRNDRWECRLCEYNSLCHKKGTV